MERKTKIPPKSTRIALVTSHKETKGHIIEMLQDEPQFKITTAITNLRNYLRNLQETDADIVLIDSSTFDPSEIGIIKTIKKTFPDLPILILVAIENEEHLFQAIMAGISGYLLKNNCGGRLVNAINDLREGGAPLSPSIAGMVLNMLQNGGIISKSTPSSSASDYKLTPREVEVLENIVKGLSYKMIGYELEISYNTVRAHMKNIYDKLQVSSLTEVVSKAISRQIVALPAGN